MPLATCNAVDQQLHYADVGQGHPIIFLNGLAGDHLYWMGQVRAFSGRYRCLAIDNRDSGRSFYSSKPYSMSDLAEDVFSLMQSLHLEPAHVVGLSLGGMIAQELALRHPEQVCGLFLADTVGRTDDWFYATLQAFGLIRRQVADTPAFFQALLPWLVSHRFFERPDRVDWLRAMLKQNPYPQRIDGFFRQLEAVRGLDTLERLPSLHCPVWVLAGEDDMIAPPRYARQLAECISQAHLVLLPGVGHAPPIEDSRGFNRVLGEFLQSAA